MKEREFIIFEHFVKKIVSKFSPYNSIHFNKNCVFMVNTSKWGVKKRTNMQNRSNPWWYHRLLSHISSIEWKFNKKKEKFFFQIYNQYLIAYTSINLTWNIINNLQVVSSVTYLIQSIIIRVIFFFVLESIW